MSHFVFNGFATTHVLSVAILAMSTLQIPQARALQPIPIGAPPASEAENLPKDEGALGDFNALREEVHRLRADLASTQNQLRSLISHVTFVPELAETTEDYATARKGFRTKLLRQGPSPQSSPPVTAPTGVSEVEYPSGNLKLKAWINRPAKEGAKRPAVLYLHGGFAFGSGDWDQAQPYRDAGFVVMAPFLRGENGQPGSFSYFYDEVDDVLSAANFLATQPYVDADRIFLAGHSVGGTMTLLASLASDRFRAAASFDGAPYWGPFTEAHDLPFDKSDPREIRLRSPLAFAGSFKCPLRAYHHVAEGDYLAEFFGLMTRRMVVVAKNRGRDVAAVPIDGDHFSHVPAAMRQSIAFFQRVSAAEIASWNGTVKELPSSVDLDLGNGVSLNCVRIRPGKYRMGSPATEVGRGADEQQHDVEIATSFCMGSHLVTQTQYKQIMGVNPSSFITPVKTGRPASDLGAAEFPVDNVSWEDAKDFCQIVSLLPGVRAKGWIVDLPTEAEWEYACRAGTSTPFHFGESLSSEQANFDGGNPYGGAPQGRIVHRPTPVAAYPANPWGLFDMHGNVYQWCQDRYAENYRAGATPGDGDRVVRGGCFFASGADCRSARREHFPQAIRKSETVNPPPIGFRVVVRTREKTARAK